MVADIRLMKDLNFNCVRCSHYPCDERWYATAAHNHPPISCTIRCTMRCTVCYLLACQVQAGPVLRTAYCALRTAYCLLPTAYCLLPTAYCLLPTTDCVLTGTSCATSWACM